MSPAPYRQRSRDILGGVALFTLLLALDGAEAATIGWQSYSPGTFQDPANWYPATVPGASDIATFGQGDLVSLEADVTTDQLLVRSGQTLHLDLGGFAYHAANQFRFADRIASPALAMTPAVVFGDDGFPGGWVTTTVTNGLLTGATGMVGREGGTLVEVTVGAGATWQSSDLLSVGGFLACGPYQDPCDPFRRDSAVGYLFVSDGARIESAQSLIGGHLPDEIPAEDPLGLRQLVDPTGKAYVQGEDSSWLTSGEMVIGRGGTGEFWVSDGATASLGSVSIGGDTLRHPSLGVLGVRDGGSVEVRDTLVVGDGGGALLSTDGASFVTSRSAIVGSPMSTLDHLPLATVGEGSLWLVEETLTVGAGGTGRLEAFRGGVVGSASFVAGHAPGSVAKINLVGSGSALHAATEVTLGGDGSATLSLRGGNLVTPHLTVSAGSSVEGVGALFTDVTVHGEIRTQLADPYFPEPVVHVLAIAGDLVLDSDGVFSIFLEGAEIEPDQVLVLGTATLMGSVEVVLDDAARNALSFGDSFDVLEAAHIVEADWQAVLPGISASLAFEFEIVAREGGGETLRLAVVPEPSTAGLVALGLAALAAARRRARISYR